MNCRACSSPDLVEILDLGAQPPANNYLASADEAETRYPLALAFCRACGLAQLRDAQPPDLFAGYRYLTGASAAARDYWATYAREAILPRVRDDDLVVDVGGNDGTLLGELPEDIWKVNIDPAANLKPFNEVKDIEHWPYCLTEEMAHQIVACHGRHARVVCANNVLAHTDDPAALLRACATLIGDDGTLIAEVHWAHHLVTQGCFDQIYHEHACYYSLGALIQLFNPCGLHISQVEVVPGQGQSLRLFASTNKLIYAPPSVRFVLEQEESLDLENETIWHSFARAARTTRRDLRALLYQLKQQGKRIIGYGAPAKGNTLLNFCGIGRDQLDYLTDTTPFKQGRYAPGSRLLIRDPRYLWEDPPDYALLLTWNHRAAILAQERELIENGMKFIVAMPRVEIIDGERRAA